MSARTRQHTQYDPGRVLRLHPLKEGAQANRVLQQGLVKDDANERPDAKAEEVKLSSHSTQPITAAAVASSSSETRISFTLPPSPPYTNPHLKRGVPLPFFDERGRIMCHHGHDDGHDSCKRGHHSLLSPPYSPHRRPLALLSVDESLEDERNGESYSKSW
jgi:hypothetical protein